MNFSSSLPLAAAAPRCRGRGARGGFSLVEIMIVVVIIALLASMALPAFQRVRRGAISKRYLNDARQIRDGAERYALETGAFPPNGIGSLHADLRGYIPESLMNSTTTVLGGVWDWDYQQDGFTASVSVYQFTAADPQLLDIDRTIDDGNLTTGLFRKMGSKVIFIIQP